MLVLRKYHLVWYFVSNSMQLLIKSVRKCPNYSWHQCTCHNVHAFIIQISSKIRISISSWVSERDASLPSPLFHSPSVLPWQSSLVGQMASETFFFFHFNLSRFHHSFIQHLMYCLIWRGEVAWFQHAQCHGELRWQGAVLLPRGSSKALSPHLPQISGQRQAARQTEMDYVASAFDRTWACSEWRHTRATKGPACMMITPHLWCAGRSLILYSKFIGMFIIIWHN